MSAPTDNLVRAWAGPQATSVRDRTDSDGSTMFGHFAVFDQWTEINSMFEGRFLERIVKGAFEDTFKARRDKIRVLYDHGADPQIGNKPLGEPTALREDGVGGYYEVDLFDASYVNDLKPAIRARQLGASFRFKVTGETWDSTGERSDHNPDGLEERTITSVDLYEFGPVTFPAYDSATVGLRSRTDEFIEHFLRDPAFVARFTERAGLACTERILATMSPTAPVTEPPAAPEAGEPPESTDGDEDEALQRRIEHFKRMTAPFDAHLSRLKETTP